MAVALRPDDPDYVDRVRNSFNRQGFMVLLDASLTRVEPGCVDIVVPYRTDLTQQHGFFHAGVTSTVADTAGGYAAYTLFPKDSSVLTVEFKINLVAPARGNRLCATGRVIKHGRTLTICAFEVFALAAAAASDHGEERRTLCATGMQTLICLPNRVDG